MPNRKDSEKKERDMGVQRDRVRFDKTGAQGEMPGEH